jgi:hypothetical protein
MSHGSKVIYEYGLEEKLQTSYTLHTQTCKLFIKQNFISKTRVLRLFITLPPGIWYQYITTGFVVGPEKWMITSTDMKEYG